MKFADLGLEALRGVRLHRLRSATTAGGFAAGTAAAVALFAVTGGARAELLERIRALGVDVIQVFAIGDADAAPALLVSDAAALTKGLHFVDEVAPLRVVESSVLLPDGRVGVRVLGTTPEYFRLRPIRFSRGRAFGAAEAAQGRNVAVLSASAARALVPTGSAYGGLVKIGEAWFRVIGVLDESATEGDARDVYLPLASTLRENLSEHQEVREMFLRIDSKIDPEAAADVVRRTLLRRRDGAERFQVLTASALVEQQRAARGILDWLLGSVAAFAFALGGFGMTALSWQGVRERRREIAIRRAIGASRAEILSQFLLEGVLVASLGGALGLLLGAVGSGVAASLGGWPWLLEPRQLILAFFVAVAVGLIATVGPARRAAALDPVTALRFEG